MRLLLALAFFCIFQATSADPARAAAFKSGNELLIHCTPDGNEATAYQNRALCYGYITGVVDAEDHYDQYSGVTDYICLPSGVTVGQMADVVVTYLRAHPETRHYAASDLVLVALGRAFPCPRS